MYKKAAVGIALATALTGCGQQGICPPSTRVELPEAEIATKNSENQKVIVMPVEIDYKDKAADKMQAVFRQNLETQIYDTGTTVVDRKIANKLKGEIKLAEQSGRFNSNGVPVADYAILTEITSSGVSKEFHESYQTEVKNIITGKKSVVTVPAKCTYSAGVKAVAKVVSLPDMKVVERFELSGRDYSSTETTNSSCPVSSHTYTTLVSGAADDAVSDSRNLKRMFAPSAAIVELRQCEAGNQVRISMGKNKKIQPKMDMSFIRRENLDGDIETLTYAEGSVVNNLNDAVKQKYSWVEVDDEVVPQLSKGDEVKVDADACGLLDFGCQINKL